MRGGNTTAYEFVQIRLTVPGQLAYIVQSGGEAPVEFNLLRQDKPNEFIFANLDNPFPSRIIYRHDIRIDRFHIHRECMQLTL